VIVSHAEPKTSLPPIGRAPLNTGVKPLNHEARSDKNAAITTIAAGETITVWFTNRPDEILEAWCGTVAAVDMAGIRLRCCWEQTDLTRTPDSALRIAPWHRIADIEVIETCGIPVEVAS